MLTEFMATLVATAVWTVPYHSCLMHKASGLHGSATDQFMSVPNCNGSFETCLCKERKSASSRGLTLRGPGGVRLRFDGAEPLSATDNHDRCMIIGFWVSGPHPHPRRGWGVGQHSQRHWGPRQ